MSRLFWWAWGAAAVLHVIGNRRWGEVWPDPTLLGFLTLALLTVGLWAMVRPGARSGLALSVLFPLTALAETPVLSNHMFLAAAVSVGALVAQPWRAGWEDRFVPVGRALLLVFYAFAAFAKLNTSFLDPSVSCAVFYADQGLGVLGLPTPGGTPWATPLPWAALLVEASVPLLLVVRRTRLLGVVLATAFHILISFDLGQHFYDFTGVLLPLFGLFLPRPRADGLAGEGAALIRGPGRLVAPVALGLLGLLGVLTLGPRTDTVAVAVQVLPFVVWVPAATAYLALLVRQVRRGRTGPSETARLGTAGWVLVGLVLVNGVLPYLEVKRVADFTMYANLHVADGETNHLVVRRSVPLRDGNADLYEIVASDDPTYAAYVESGWWLPAPNVAAAPPGSDTVLRLEGEPAGPPPPLEGAEVWFNRLMPLRAVDAESPTRCQTGFLPAH